MSGPNFAHVVAPLFAICVALGLPSRLPAAYITEMDTISKETPVAVFNTIPSNSALDAANGAAFTASGPKWFGPGDANLLGNGSMALDGAETNTNFFFADNQSEHLIFIDLGQPVTIGQINTYSWQDGNRSFQDYEVYGSNNSALLSTLQGDDPLTTDPSSELIEMVDALLQGGQVGVSITSRTDLSPIGTFQYLAFLTHTLGGQNTFWNEIDVVAAAPSAQVPEPSALVLVGGVGAALVLLAKRRRR